MQLSPKELASLLKQSTENIRLWSGEFSAYLSKDAAPEKRGKHRVFEEGDISVLALVADFRDRGIPFPAIHKALAEGDRMMPATLQGSLVTYQTQLTDLQAKLADAESDLKKESKRADTAEIEVELLKRQNKELQEKIDRLNREIGRLEVRQDSE